MAIKTSRIAMQNLLINTLGEKYRIFITLSLHWRNTVGNYLAKYSQVVKIEKNILFIGVKNNVILQELVLIKDDLKVKINRTLSLNIQEIVFFISDYRSRKNPYE